MSEYSILIMMSDTGGGHRASAQAIQAGFAQRYGDRFHVDIVDMWVNHTPFPLNKIPKSYSFMTTETPWLWKFAWNASEHERTTRLVMNVTARWTKKPIRQLLQERNYHLIISVHPLMQHIPLKILDQMGKCVPFVTVVTDLVSINRVWFHPQVDLCFVASPEAYRRGLRAGLTPAQLRQFGLPIRPIFAQESRPKETLRRELGMQAETPAVLVVGGGEGMGPVGEIAKAVANRLKRSGSGQLVVICGRNYRLRGELESHTWPVPTVIAGFVNNMSDWMAACDCLVSKAGPGTIAEAMVRGLPVVLSGYIPGQEEGNVPYVVENGVGTYSEDPEIIAEIVGRWCGPERDKLAEMSRRAHQLGNPRATFQIVEEIAGLLKSSGASRGGTPRQS